MGRSDLGDSSGSTRRGCHSSAAKDPPNGRAPHVTPPGPGTFEGVAGFRIGRGRDTGARQTRDRNAPRTDSRRPRDRRTAAPRRLSPRTRSSRYGGGAPAPAGSPWPPGPRRRSPRTGRTRRAGVLRRRRLRAGPRCGTPSSSPVRPVRGATTRATPRRSRIDDPYNQGDTYRAGPAPAPGPVGPRLHWKDLLKGVAAAHTADIGRPAGAESIGLLHRERGGGEHVPIGTADDGALHQVLQVPSPRAASGYYPDDKSHSTG
ncbi:hypothetical protein SVIOM342S_02092 [Streptomyces violaceorubidus]